MAVYDIFNGDADGITALIQLRLAQPKQSELVTGVKRDISLVQKISVEAGDELNVLDVSLQKNHASVMQALEKNAQVFYVDHHAMGAEIEHRNFNSVINTSANVCTSLLINGYLDGAYPLWAIVGAYGDNLNSSAKALAKQCVAQLAEQGEEGLALLKELGILLNYNAYGFELEDLHFKPQDLYQLMVKYPSPFDFIQQQSACFKKLQQGYAQDMQHVESCDPHFVDDCVAIFILPDEAWARRINGVFGNNLTNTYAERAHAVLVKKDQDTFMVSVRAPLNDKKGAGEFCSRFATGGGREAAAGINALPVSELDQFVEDFSNCYRQFKSNKGQ